ncbi:hypothetical protein HT102_14270 [Hoyosella sp. G463]|uniref:Uncharacterized protein n=1 Tax=Lolliginicoccus lacisalsi TaxID=2742202 RepID=A0A927PN31_9ACTN|nr:hypothetical protein [Lolliginicoccus lacisalsi]MBD8507649.1 hypothetical protein [Lolliginicoccus lacisalsi]
MLASVVVLAGCGGGEDPEDSAASPDGATSTPPATSQPSGDGAGPPPITVSAGGSEHVLEPWSYCWDGTCVDGTPPAEQLALGSAEDVRISFPEEDATFIARMREAGGGECARTFEASLERDADDVFVLEPMGMAGEYEVLLAVRGSSGDAAVSFTWTTPRDGAIAEPEATLAIASPFVPLGQARPDMSVSNLGTDPGNAAVTIEIVAADGSMQSIGSEAATIGCPEGSVRFFGTSDDPALTDAPGPYEYRVTLELDDDVHEAVAVWPSAEGDGSQPYVPLVFEPPLPGLG